MYVALRLGRAVKVQPNNGFQSDGLAVPMLRVTRMLTVISFCHITGLTQPAVFCLRQHGTFTLHVTAFLRSASAKMQQRKNMKYRSAEGRIWPKRVALRKSCHITASKAAAEA